MRVALSGVAKGRALPDTSVTFTTGSASLTVAETEQRPTVLGLIASGRMRPSTGTVLIDGTADASALRLKVALVDAPDVSDPAPNVIVAAVVGEELMFAGRRSDPRSVRAWLDAHGVRAISRVPIAAIDPTVRIRLLLELAALRPGVEGIVLVSPDRHGGDPLDWWAIAQEFARRGLAVLVIAGDAAASVVAAVRPRHHPARIRLRRTPGLSSGGRG